MDGIKKMDFLAQINSVSSESHPKSSQRIKVESEPKQTIKHARWDESE